MIDTFPINKCSLDLLRTLSNPAHFAIREPMRSYRNKPLFKTSSLVIDNEGFWAPAVIVDVCWDESEIAINQFVISNISQKKMKKVNEWRYQLDFPNGKTEWVYEKPLARMVKQGLFSVSK